ncbi:PfkB family carbohydrate kinase [Secundilactobacillus collinoides]|uniref:Ribokinase family sugar kinase n=2 Tax=Secundilactobacillus collinoides TaxID=33960 RepID=A0A0R2BEI7_SECCO|nr:PfkB family carbohydrate kinase [Secundilactobacillus collinoides]KRM77768.1 ribokinase family sugar kinase [Secundilactobacillus collinoides DSM 20515 = JCM 1123]KZL42521.1 ribokinase [Secundilactobacillus collinoides]
MGKILVIGAAFVDVLVHVPKLPQTGDDVTGNLQGYRVGGSAFNVYGAIRYAQSPVDLFVPVGQGQYANQVRETLNKNQISQRLSVTDADNGWDVAFVEPNGERSFLTINGVEQLWQPKWFDNIMLTDYDYFYVSGYELENETTGSVILDALSRRRPDATVLFDTSPRISFLSERTRQHLFDTNVLIHCNETELNYLVPGPQSLPKKLTALFELTHQPVVVTLGARGCYYNDGQTSAIMPVDPVHVVNTIGAGDTHCGGLLAALNQGAPFTEAVQHANQLAAMVVAQEKGSLLDVTKP